MSCLVGNNAASGAPSRHYSDGLKAGTSNDDSSGPTTTNYYQPSISHTPDGGTVTTYSLPDDEQLVTATPPQGFSPLTASPQTLQEYNFPAEPTDPTQQADWQTAMAAYRSDAPPSGPLPVTTGGPTFTVYGTWGGWTAGDLNGSGNKYVAVKGDQVVPNPTNTCSGSNITGFWVGLGGTNGNLLQQGFVCGDSDVGSGSAFRPFTEFANTKPPVAFCGYTSWTLPHGDKVYENMSYQTSSDTAYFYLEDETTGTTHSCSASKPSGWTYTGNTADWEGEAPGGTAVHFGSVKFTNSNAELGSTGAWVTLGSQTTTKEIQGISSTTYCISPGSISSGTDFTDSFNQAACY